MVRSEPGTEHPPREAVRPREAVGDVFLARWPSQTERRFVGQGRPVPWPPIPSSSAVAARGRGGVDPASSGAGRAVGLAVRGADAASDAGAASAGSRPGRAVALRRLLPQRRGRGRGGVVGRRRPEPVRRARGRRGRRLGYHRPGGRTPGLGRRGRGGGAGADPERRRPRPRHAVARRRAVPGRSGRSSTSDRPGGAAAAHSGPGDQGPDRVRLRRRGRAAQRRLALRRRHPVSQRHGPEQPAGARRPARRVGRRSLGPDPVRARRPSPLHHPAGRRAGDGAGIAPDAERPERRHPRLRAGCGAHDRAHLHRRSGGDGHGDGVQPASPDPRPAVRGLPVDAASQWSGGDADVFGRLSHQSGAGRGAGSGHGRRRAVLDRGLHPSPHRRDLGRRDDPAAGRGAGAGAGQPRRQQRGGGRLRRQPVAHPGAGGGAGERLGARDCGRAATGDGRPRRSRPGDDHPGRKLQRPGAARGRAGAGAGARPDRRSGRPGAGQSGRQRRFPGARRRRAVAAGPATDRRPAGRCGCFVVAAPAHGPRGGDQYDQRYGAGRPDHDGRGRQRADGLDHRHRHRPARHHRPLPRRQRPGHLRSGGPATHPDRGDPPVGRAPPAGADRGHRRRTERQGRARSGRAVVDGGRAGPWTPCCATICRPSRLRLRQRASRWSSHPWRRSRPGRCRLWREPPGDHRRRSAPALWLRQDPRRPAAGGGRGDGGRGARGRRSSGPGRGAPRAGPPAGGDAAQRRRLRPQAVGSLCGRATDGGRRRRPVPAGGAGQSGGRHSGGGPAGRHGRRAGHPPDQRHAPAGADAGGRGAARGAEPEPARGAAAGVAHQGHGAAGHRREAQAPGRAHPPDAGRQVAGRARLDPAVAGGRAGGAADSGQGSGRADAGPAGHGPRRAGGLPPCAGRAERHHAGHRADRLGQDHHPVRRAVAAERRLAQYPDGRGSGRIRHGGRGPDAGESQGRHDLRCWLTRHSAPRPGRGHGRRNPRHGDGGYRRSGLPDRPPGAVDAAHQRRGRGGDAPARHGRGALPAGLVPAAGGGAAAGAAAVPALSDRGDGGQGDGAPDRRRRRRADGAGLSVRVGGGGAGRHRRHDDLHRAQGGRSVRQHGPDPAAADTLGHRSVGPDAGLGLADGAGHRRRRRRGADRAAARSGAAEAGRLGAQAAAGRTADARPARGAHGPHPVDHDRGGPAGAGGADHHRPHRLQPRPAPRHRTDGRDRARRRGPIGRYAPRRGLPAHPRLHDRVGRKQRSAGAHAGARGRLSGTRILQLHRRDAQPAGAGDHRGHGRDRRRDRAVDPASHPSDQHPGSGVREALMSVLKTCARRLRYIAKARARRAQAVSRRAASGSARQGDDRPADLRLAGGGGRAGAGAIDRQSVRGEGERGPGGGAATYPRPAARRSGAGDGAAGARADGAASAAGDHGAAVSGRSAAGAGPQRLEQSGRCAARLGPKGRISVGRGSAGAAGGAQSGRGAGRTAAGAVSRREGGARRLHPERVRGARLFRQQRPALAGRRTGDADARRLRPGRTVVSGRGRMKPDARDPAVERPRLRPAAGRGRGAGGDPRRPVLLQSEQSGAGAGRGSDRAARRGGAVHRARRRAGLAARADGGGRGGPDRLDGRRRRGFGAGGGGRRLRQPPDALSHRRGHVGRGQRTARRGGRGRRPLSPSEALSVRPAGSAAVAPEREYAGAAGRRSAGRDQPGRGGPERGQGGHRCAPGDGLEQPGRLLGPTRPVGRGRRRRGQGPDHPGHPLLRPEGRDRAWRRPRRPHRPDPRRARRRGAHRGGRGRGAGRGPGRGAGRWRAAPDGGGVGQAIAGLAALDGDLRHPARGRRAGQSVPARTAGGGDIDGRTGGGRRGAARPGVRRDGPAGSGGGDCGRALFDLAGRGGVGRGPGGGGDGGAGRSVAGPRPARAGTGGQGLAVGGRSGGGVVGLAPDPDGGRRAARPRGGRSRRGRRQGGGGEALS
uniref:LigA n=1 Tax=Parastrongyloides trichosuri TaxID=131310 RepID=A0A0N4ZD68_PARTI